MPYHLKRIAHHLRLNVLAVIDVSLNVSVPLPMVIMLFTDPPDVVKRPPFSIIEPGMMSAMNGALYAQVTPVLSIDDAVRLLEGG